MDNPLVFQRAFLSSELEHLLDLMRHRHVGGSILANERVWECYAKGSTGELQEDAKVPARRSLDEARDCPICFDRMQAADETTACHVCSAWFHQDCMLRWIGLQQLIGSPTCPNCRSTWHTVGSSGREVGYVNLGALQGQSPVRDDSTYRRCPD